MRDHARQNQRLRHCGRGLLVAAASSLLAITGAASAQAGPSEQIDVGQKQVTKRSGYHQACSDVSGLVSGRLCIDATGNPNTNGTIGVGWWQSSASYASIKLCWTNSAGGEYCQKGRTVVGGGESTSATWPSFLTVGCHASPKIIVYGENGPVSTTGYPLCVA